MVGGMKEVLKNQILIMQQNELLMHQNSLLLSDSKFAVMSVNKTIDKLIGVLKDERETLELASLSVPGVVDKKTEI